MLPMVPYNVFTLFKESNRQLKKYFALGQKLSHCENSLVQKLMKFHCLAYEGDLQ